jgi:hypothetical protein
MGAAILGVLSALPDIIKLGQQFGVWINHVSGNDPRGFIKQVGAAMAQLNQAKSVQERQDAAKAIADALHNLS